MGNNPDFRDGGDMFGHWIKRGLQSRFGQVLNEDVPESLLHLLDTGYGRDDISGQDDP
ncbi:hypothetical protein [Komagataeibacter medellinensis]|uniref:hypothetical protein n=1 Tax=Komagataeibacter medellinensis TaxID=1177712 RepID=UPI0012971AE6|nr:hypothetical protein [Komagataeibacter medellinensis]